MSTDNVIVNRKELLAVLVQVESALKEVQELKKEIRK
jgi:hypothetical protein